MAVIALLGVSVVSISTATALPGDQIVFPDQNLENAINDELGRAHGTPVTEADAATLTDLDAPTAGIIDLTGIEHLTGLTSLYLGGNDVSDISALSGLTALSNLNLSQAGITDISALSGLTNLTELYLSSNDLTDVATLSGLTQVRVLYLSNNRITDVSPVRDMTDLAFLTFANNRVVDLSPLTDLTELTSLHMNNNSITDISALSGLTEVRALTLRLNSVADISPLAGLTALSTLRLDDQSFEVPSAVVGASTANPVIDGAGNPVPVASSDTSFTYDPVAHAWAFTTTGTKVLTWHMPVTIGMVTDAEFSGEISQSIGRSPLVPAAPQDPHVVQAVCESGAVVGPQVDLPTTDGIDYVIEGDVEPGATITVRATPADDHHSIVVDPDSDWIGNSDRLYATLEITLETVACATTPAVDDDRDSPTTDGDGTGVPSPGDDGGASQPTAHRGTLPRTGVSQSMTLLGAVGALMVVTGAALVASRRRFATR